MTETAGSPATEPPPTYLAERVWHYWHGSPQLLAHVARVALVSVGGEGGDKATSLIDLKAGDDHEVFSSASEFVNDVSREGLSHFTSIRIKASNGDLEVDVVLIWRMSRWSFRSGEDADVRLKVRGPDETVVQSAYDAVHGALKRGGTESRWLRFLPFLMGGCVALLALVVGLSGSYLLRVSATTAFVIGGVLAVAGVVWSVWAYASLEIAPFGETRFVRILKIGIPLALGLVATGLVTRVTGS